MRITLYFSIILEIPVLSLNLIQICKGFAVGLTTGRLIGWWGEGGMGSSVASQSRIFQPNNQI